MTKGGRCHLCLDATIPDGMVCPAGPDGCGYCLGRVCDQAVPDGQQDLHHEVSDTWPEPP